MNVTDAEAVLQKRKALLGLRTQLEAAIAHAKNANSGVGAISFEIRVTYREEHNEKSVSAPLTLNGPGAFTLLHEELTDVDHEIASIEELFTSIEG